MVTGRDNRTRILFNNHNHTFSTCISQWWKVCVWDRNGDTNTESALTFFIFC